VNAGNKVRRQLFSFLSLLNLPLSLSLFLSVANEGISYVWGKDTHTNQSGTSQPASTCFRLELKWYEWSWMDEGNLETLKSTLLFSHFPAITCLIKAALWKFESSENHLFIWYNFACYNFLARNILNFPFKKLLRNSF
jgi:hypothetical protein